MLAEAFLNGSVSRLVPDVPENYTFVLVISLNDLVNELHGPFLNVHVGKAGLPSAKERTVIASAKSLALRTDSDSVVLVEYVLGSAFEQEFHNDLAVVLLCKLKQSVNVGKIVFVLAKLVVSPVDPYLKGIQIEVAHAINIALPFLGQRRRRSVILCSVNNLVKKHDIPPLLNNLSQTEDKLRLLTTL